ncbi:CHAT domain-containing protein [Mycena epipterygia]|nr:CHAT domain-containing protein [Mycena epipterygia]
MDDNPDDIVALAGNILTDFYQSTNLLSLNTAICFYDEAISRQDSLDIKRYRTMCQLANAHLIRSRATGDPEGVQKSIPLVRQLYRSQPNQVSWLCAALLSKVEFTNVIDAIDLMQEALKLDENALKLAEAGAELLEVFEHAGDLGIGLHMRYRTRGSVQDLDNAIVLHCEALNLQSAPHPNRGGALNNLAIVLYERFQTGGDAGDLDNSIELHHEALDLHPAPHSYRGRSLTNLASVLHGRFQIRGDGRDLDNSVELYHEALLCHPAAHPQRSGSLNNLAIVLHERFQTRGDIGDLDNAIVLLRETLDLHPAHHPDRAISLSNLANVLQDRFKIRRDAEDLDNALELNCEAQDLCPTPHPARAISLNSLANVHDRRFQTRGGAEDLDNAIGLHREVLDLCPAPHPARGNALTNLALALDKRFQTRGDAEDLHDAIELHREALDLHPAPHPEHGDTLINLASVLHSRFKTRGDTGDLDNAILLHREALELCPAPHPQFSGFLNSLANVLYERFETRGDPGDLDNAIVLYHKSLDLKPAPHPDRGDSLNNIAVALLERFRRRHDAGDLDTAIMLHHEALDLCPAPHSAGMSLSNLASALHERFKTRGDAGDLDDAIKLCDEAQGFFHPPHPYRATALRQLAIQLSYKHDNSSDRNILEDAIIAFRESSGYLPSPVSERCRAAIVWADQADKHNHISALEAYEIAVELLPQQAMLGLDIQSRQKALTLKSMIGVATDAAACASQLNELGKAVEFLEAGRSVFWSQALQLHTSLDDLEAVHPELAEKIQDISKALEVGSHRAVASIRLLPAMHKDHTRLDKDDTHYRKLNAKWVEVIDEVRRQPGFEGFLRPKLMNELRAAAINGPVIILNSSRSSCRCTALIVTPSSDAQYINLDSMSLPVAEFLVKLLRAVLSGSRVIIGQLLQEPANRQAFMASQDRLLWKLENSQNYDFNKIFEALLEILWVKKSDHPSRLWWCPTGPFTFLPIHAAGIYRSDETDCVSDYVVSSYTHTLTTLLNPPTGTASPFKMTAVIQPTTDNCLDLPATVKELERIKEQVPFEWLISLGDTTPATVDVAQQHLQESSVVHFACHGTQDLQNPLETGLILTDGRLKVSELMRKKSPKKSMTLAFLSACETAKGDETVPDEAMHLAATLLFAGFQGVVATMWTIADPDGPKIAETFYRHLFKDCDTNTNPPILPDLTKAAECLHIAVAKLRANPNVPFSRWVPFVHYGL